jgi:hypothetical protein
MIKKFATILTVTLAATALLASPPAFTPGRVVVLRVGNTNLSGTIVDWNSGKQNPIYIDEFATTNVAAILPTYSVALPTNGANSVWINGGAGTEGGMSRAADRSILALTGYHGDVGSQPGTPSNLPYQRAVGTVDAFGTNTLALVSDNWYGITTGKTNPRGVTTDGTNSFWGSGNNVGTMYYNPGFNDGYPTMLQNLSATRMVKILNGSFYTSVIGKDGSSSYPCGIYNFLDYNNQPVALPTGFVQFHLVIPAYGQYTNISGFYLNPAGNIAYTADLAWGVQKYVKTGGQWQFACNYSVGGYEQQSSGALAVTNDVKNSFGGAFDVVVDFSGTNPVIYATTEDISYVNNKNANTNRIVRIVDTNNLITGLTYTNFTVIAQAASTNVGFRAIDFAPDLRPVIGSAPVGQSVTNGSTVTFTVAATQSGYAGSLSSLSYQWLSNGVPVAGQTGSSLSFTANLSFDGGSYQCVVSNLFGAVTSAPPAVLNVTTLPVAPYNLGGLLRLTNAVGDNVSITASAAGTSPLSYQWYAGNPAAGGVVLADANEFTGTATATLSIGNAQFGVDDTNYYCVVSNVAGTSNIFAATLKLVYSKPAFSSQPSALTVFSNTPAQFSSLGFGQNLSYQWYSNNIAVAGANSSTLTVNPAIVGGNYFVVVTNLGGAITSSVAALTVVIPPAHTFVKYTNTTQVYVQNFNSLPVITNATVNTANPVSFWQVGSAGAQVTYYVADPFDFGYPVLASGGVGGLGLTNTMPGWYGWGQLSSKLGAHQGDQSTGGIIDYGTLATGGLTGGTNRALGLQSTSTTGSTAFGVKFINNTTNTLAAVTLSYLGEIWRNQPRSNALVFGYYIDTDGTNSAFSPTNSGMVYVPALNVSFNTNAAGLLVLDGTQSANQIILGATNLAISTWPTNAALWLVWQQLDSAGGAQGIAIDNLSFSASATVPATVITPVNINAASAHVTGSGASGAASFSFTNASGLTFSVLATNNINAPRATWPVIGTATETPAGSGNYQFTDPNPATNTSRFYILRQP